MLLFAACEPGAPVLEGAPAPAVEKEPAPGELAGAGPSASSMPTGAMGILPPQGVQVIDRCERVIAADYSKPPEMACLLFQTEDVETGKLDADVIVAISEAGWTFIRAQGAEHYFERPRAGTDCAEVAVVSVIEDRVPALLAHAGAAKPAGADGWQAYAIPVVTREACGADRMRPEAP